MHTIKYHKSVIKTLNRLPLIERRRIVNKIHNIVTTYGKSNLDIKRFSNTQHSWRLRVGNIRIIYQLIPNAKLVLIRKIGYRGDIYKH